VNIQLLSDLHLEAHPDFQCKSAPGADLLVLAGDIGSYQNGSKLSPIGNTRWGLERFSPAMGWPTPVLFVPGNHEYDLQEFELAHAALKTTCAELGITWLERETTVLNGVRFIGTTLWTDFDAFATGNTVKDIKARDKAFKAANFWLRQAAGTRAGEPFLAPQMRDLALECQAWLRAALAAPFDGKTVVITHFAPSLQSADKRYGMQPGTAGFCNALDALLPQADLWMHGHLHCPHDYRAGRCRVVANPLGYARKSEQVNFNAERLYAI
jgi:predicted phosphodiesterase